MLQTALVTQIVGAGTGTATDTAAVLNGTAVECTATFIQNHSDSVDLYVGNSTAQPIKLWPRQSVTIPSDSSSRIYVKTASGTAAYGWLAVR